MKSLRRLGCWTTFILIFALGTFIFLFTQSRQGRNEFSVRHEQRNVTVFGGDVRIGEDEQIMGNLLVVGDDLTLEGRIGGNLVVVGGDVELTGHAQVGGNVSVVGGDADVEGSSVIGGNVAAVGGDIELAGHARIDGSVRVVGGRIKQDPAVHVGGEVAETARNQAKLHREAVLEEPKHVWAFPLTRMTDAQRRDFEVGRPGLAGWPEVGSRAMQRLATGVDMDNGWVVVQPAVYRYRVEQDDGLVVRAILRDYLATEVHWV